MRGCYIICFWAFIATVDTSFGTPKDHGDEGLARRLRHEIRPGVGVLTARGFSGNPRSSKLRPDLGHLGHVVPWVLGIRLGIGLGSVLLLGCLGVMGVLYWATGVKGVFGNQALLL
ncbi:hypothetical protein J1N35_012716 [Gossypium stocksii]|uniref:Uncharacterized protein n=1 Tax=Gossypium stocksii TaxID=47602 RepID=A0A9D3W6W0_9ROSI|nr:hypothetical protein J1N35_012716 [Gossypium stocksii]